ncbi:MAG: hypothetical protein ETSY1_00085 [Candidatus Entotheonella factor]|uniref:P-type ATPase A domain-containing protein n=1 Tax=Entotheonella factor TaxID=1429438 RepID=W4M178_ENTF1|nr:MAG: hypothetical protein ETSY1_00085 [Candidatus Entotheonella factor]
MIGVLLAGFLGYYLAAHREPESASPQPGLPEDKSNLPQRQAHTSASEPLDMSQEEQHLNQQIRNALGLLGLVTAGNLGYPLLTLVSLPFLLYQAIPIFQAGYRELVKRRKIGSNVFAALIQGSMLIMGYFWAVALGNVINWGTAKLVYRVQNNSRQRLSSVFGELPRSVWIPHEGIELEVPLEQIEAGDTIIVHAGEAVPVDGVITDGMASIDQHLLTGEARPVEKEAGEAVYAATLVLSGTISVQVEKAGADTVVANIEAVLQETAYYTSSLELKAIDIGDRIIPIMLVLSAVTLPILDPVAASCVLTCGLGGRGMKILAPLSLLNFLKIAAEHHMIVKDGRVLELLHDVDTIVFDKTGTLTHDQPCVTAIHACGSYCSTELLRFAAAAESRQSHPIANAIRQEAETCQLALPSLDDAAYEVGYGLKVGIDGQVIRVGSERFMAKEGIEFPPELVTVRDDCHNQGYVLVYVAIDQEIGGAIELHPTLRPEVKEMIAALRQRQLNLYIVSGDHEHPTRQLAQDLGIESYVAQTLPEQKAELIAQLQDEGKSVCFIGDGINDAIALKTAHVSISLSGASTVALDTAQVLFTDGTLNPLLDLFELADDVETNMRRHVACQFSSTPFVLIGVYAWQFRFFETLLLHTIGGFAGIANSMMPVFDKKWKVSANGSGP